MKEFWSDLKGLARKALRRKDAPAAEAAPRAARPSRRPLVVDRPASLEQRYELIERDDVADEVFRRLQRHVYEALDRRAAPGPTVFRETGRLAVPGGGAAGGRRYFYLKPQDRPGWLFERSGGGWVVSRAEKIVARDLFLRQGEAVDLVSLFMAKDGAAYPRVRSPLLGNELLSFAVYEQKLMERMGLS